MIRYSVIIQCLEECVQTASQNLWNRRRERKQPDVLDPAWGCKCHARHRYIVIIIIIVRRRTICYAISKCITYNILYIISLHFTSIQLDLRTLQVKASQLRAEGAAVLTTGTSGTFEGALCEGSFTVSMRLRFHGSLSSKEYRP